MFNETSIGYGATTHAAHACGSCLDKFTSTNPARAKFQRWGRDWEVAVWQPGLGDISHGGEIPCDTCDIRLIDDPTITPGDGTGGGTLGVRGASGGGSTGGAAGYGGASGYGGAFGSGAVGNPPAPSSGLSLPSWLLPVALIGIAAFALMGKK